MSNPPKFSGSPPTGGPTESARLIATNTVKDSALPVKQEGRLPQSMQLPDGGRPPLSAARPGVPGTAPASYPNARVLVMSPVTESAPRSPIGGPPPTARTTLPDPPQKAAETSARRLADVNVDVQQTSFRAAAVEQFPAEGVVSVGKPVPVSPQQAMQPDVKVTSPRSAVAVDPRTRSPRQTRKPKRQTDQDASGRYRHTLRLEPKAEQKLRAVADALGVDLNAAISVCIAEKYTRLLKPGNGDL